MNKNEVDDIAKAMSILSVSKDFEVTKDMLLHIVALMNKHNKLSIGLDELILELHEIFVKDKGKSNFSPEYKFTSPPNINLQDTTNDIKTVPNFNNLNGSKNLTENMNSLHLDKEFIKSDIANDNDNTNSNETKTSSEMNIDSKVEFSLGTENISTRLTTRSSARKSKIKTQITNKNSANLDSDIFGTTTNAKTNPLPELDPLNLPFSSPLKTELPEVKTNFKIESNFINSNLQNDTVPNISIPNPNLENLKNVSTPLNSHNNEFRGNNNSFSDNNMETPLSNAMDTSNSSHTDTNTPYVATTPSNNTFLFSFGDNSNASVILDKSNNDIFFSPGISDQPSIKTINKKVKPTSNKKIIKPRSTRNTPSSSRVNRKFKLNDDDDDDNINEEGARDDQNTLNTNIDTMNTFSANFNKENDINSSGFNNPFKGDTDNLNDYKGSSINLETPTTLKSPTRSTTEKSNSSIDDHDDSNIDYQIEKKNRPQEVSFSLPSEPIKSYLDFKINHCYSNNTPDSTSISKNNKYFYDKESTHVDESLAVLADMYRKQGRDFYANEDYVNALDSFSKALTQAPFNWVHKVAVLGNRAATYMMLNRFTDVINDCNDAIKLDNTVLKLYSRKARAFLRLGYLSESEEIFQYLSKINNSSSDADIINEAAQYIDLITTLKDNLLLLVTYDNSNKYEEVIKISDEILQTCTYSFNTIKSKANALFKLSKFTETKQFIESIFCNIHISIINTLIYNNMNITVPNENDLQWVIKNNKIVIHKDSVVNFLLCLGRDISHIYINSLKNHEYNYLLSTSIMEEINQIIQQLYSRTTPNNLNNDNSWDWINLEKKKIDKLKSNKLSGDNSFRLKKYYEALHFYTLAVEIDSNALIWKAILYNNRAASYMGIDLFKEALNDCNDSIACDNKYYKAYLRRARVYRSLNQYLESVADYRTYLKSIQNDITKVNEYNEISSECNEYVQAQAFRGKQNNNRWDRSPGKKGSGDYTTFEKKSHDFKYGNMESDEEDDDCGWFDNPKKQSSYTKPQSPNAKAYNNHNNKGFYTNNYGSSKPNNYRNDTKPSNNRTNAGYNSYFKYNHSNKSSNDNTTTQPIDEDDLYHILNVTNKATEREIKLSYRKLALQFHPDKNKDDGAEDKFKKITTAYATLSDKNLRYKYDLTRPF